MNYLYFITFSAKNAFLRILKKTYNMYSARKCRLMFGNLTLFFDVYSFHEYRVYVFPLGFSYYRQKWRSKKSKSTILKILKGFFGKIAKNWTRKDKMRAL